MRISRDHPFRHVGLRKEEPVEPALGDPGVTALQGLDDRHCLDDHEPGNAAWMVHRQTESDMAAPIMADDRELIKVQLSHQLGKIIGDGAFRLLAVIISNDRLARTPITPHVRADHSESGGDQLRRDPMPGSRGPGMAVDQE